jgi:hypothetical protein
VLITCATTGRPEHGTPRSFAASSNLSVGLGWDYCRKLTRKDFVGVLNLDEAFTEFIFSHDWDVFDLYFIDVKPSMAENGGLKASQTCEKLRKEM